MAARSKKCFYAQGLDEYLYDGDVVDLHEYAGHFILKYGWAMLNKRPYKGWYFRSINDRKLIIQAASVNLSLIVIHTRNDKPDELPEPIAHLRHS